MESCITWFQEPNPASYVSLYSSGWTNPEGGQQGEKRPFIGILYHLFVLLVTQLSLQVHLIRHTRMTVDIFPSEVILFFFFFFFKIYVALGKRQVLQAVFAQ